MPRIILSVLIITILFPLGRCRSKETRKRVNVKALNFSFSPCVTKVPFLILTAPNRETDFLVGAMRSLGSLSFRRDPHGDPRPMLLEVTFIEAP